MHTRCLFKYPTEENCVFLRKMEGGLVQQHEIVDNRMIRKKKIRRRSMMLSSSSSSSSSSTTMVKDCNNSRKSMVKREVVVPVCLGLQRLYGLCKNVFKGVGFVPPAHDVHKLCTILDSMKPEDLGLSSELQFFKPGSPVNKSPRVLCTTVYECPKFSLVLFFLPASAVIPLHNHPEMTVFSKLLLGKMHIKAYDWADSEDGKKVEHHESPSSLRLARLKADSEFTAPCNTSVLYPTSGGNIHEFTAITPCAVLDVIGPPYSKVDGRDSSYYEEIECGFSDGKWEALKDKDDGQSYAWLKEIELPEHAEMDPITYLGPRIVETEDS